MPKPRPKPVTFDQWVGQYIEGAMKRRGMRQEDLAAATGIAKTLIGRIIRGTRPVTVLEFEVIAGVVNYPAGQLLADALEEYGGMDKLLAEHAPSEVASTVDDLAKKRESRTGEIDVDEYEGRSAANVDPEHERDEPDPA